MKMRRRWGGAAWREDGSGSEGRGRSQSELLSLFPFAERALGSGVGVGLGDGWLGKQLARVQSGLVHTPTTH